MMNRGHALSRDELIRALTAYSGITTADGAPGGTTLIDANLIGRNDFITEKSILIMSGPAAYEDKGASSFNPLTGQITLQSAVSAQITAGTIFRILNISSVEIDVANINTKIGTNVDVAGTTTLFAWFAKLFASGTTIAGAVSDAGPATTDFDTDLTEATNEHYRGLFLMFLDGVCAGQGHTIDSYTGATKNVAFAVGDIFTDAPANGDNFVILPAEGRLLQLIVAAVAALMADVGDASAATLGSLLGILGDPAQTFLAMIGYEGATSLANKLTAARATLLEQITALRMAELDPAGLPADVAAVAAEIVAVLADTATLIANLALVQVDTTAILVDTETTIPGTITALQAGVDAIPTAPALAASWTAALATALAAYTAARGGYLDELAAANIPADIDELKTSKGRQLFSMDFWSVPQISVIVPIAAATQPLPDVVVDRPAGATVVKATAMFKFRMLDNAGAANKLTNAQHIQIQKGAGAFADAISLVEDQFGIAAAAREGGDVVIGDHNVVATVDTDETYGFQWTDAIADVAGLTFNDLQMGIRIWYSV